MLSLFKWINFLFLCCIWLQSSGAVGSVAYEMHSPNVSSPQGIFSWKTCCKMPEKLPLLPRMGYITVWYGVKKQLGIFIKSGEQNYEICWFLIKIVCPPCTALCLRLFGSYSVIEFCILLYIFIRTYRFSKSSMLSFFVQSPSFYHNI